MPKQSEIAERAHRIWEREGRPDGCDLEHWLRAERELIEEALAEHAPHVEIPRTRQPEKKRTTTRAGRSKR